MARNNYILDFALDTLPPYALIGETYEIKICVVHIANKGIGKSQITPIRIQAYHARDGKHATRDLLYEVTGATEIPTEGIATIQIRFPQQQYCGEIFLVANGDGVESSRPYKLKLARFKLHIHNFHKDIFFKDSFGKYSYIKTIVYLLGSENRLIQDVMVPLQVSLRYEDNIEEEVLSTSDKPPLNLFDLHHRIEKGCSLIPFRIEVVSSSHNNRSFVFYVQPEANTRYDDGSILPCVSSAIDVKARLRPFNPERTPPKYNPNRYHQEQDAIRQSAKEMLDRGTAEIQEALKSSPATTTTSTTSTPTPSPPQRKSSASPPQANSDLDLQLGGMTLTDSSTPRRQQQQQQTMQGSTMKTPKTSTPTNSRSPVSPIAVKSESGNTQSARSIFRTDLPSAATAPVTPTAKSTPIQDSEAGDDEEDWVINFTKNSLVISGIELDRWEERILRGTRSSAIADMYPSTEDSKPSATSSPTTRSVTTTNTPKK